MASSDDFNRSDAATLGANWTASKGCAGECGIFSNAADLSVANDRVGSYYSAATAPADQFSQATIPARAAAEHDVTVRDITSGTVRNHYKGGHYFNNFGDFRYRITKVVAGAETDLASHGSLDVTAGDVLYLEVVGTALTLKANGVTRVSTTDGGLSTGQPGLFAQHTAVNVALFDDWSGGDLSPLPVPMLLNAPAFHPGRGVLNIARFFQSRNVSFDIPSVAAAALEAAVVATAVVVADLTTGIALAAALTGTAVVSAALTTAIQLAAALTATAVVAASLTTGIQLAASLTGTATVSAALSTSILLSAALTGTATLTGTLTGISAALASSLTGTATVSASLSTGIVLAAALVGTATVAAALTTGINLQAALTGTATVSAALSTAILLAASLTGTATLAADLTAGTSGAALAAALTGTAMVSAALTTGIALAAAMTGTASVTAALTGVAAQLAASLTGTALVSATLSTAIRLASALTATATLTADLTAPSGSAALVVTLTVTATLVASLAIPVVTDGLAAGIVRSRKAVHEGKAHLYARSSLVAKSRVVRMAFAKLEGVSNLVASALLIPNDDDEAIALAALFFASED